MTSFTVRRPSLLGRGRRPEPVFYRKRSPLAGIERRWSSPAWREGLARLRGPMTPTPLTVWCGVGAASSRLPPAAPKDRAESIRTMAAGASGDTTDLPVLELDPTHDSQVLDLVDGRLVVRPTTGASVQDEWLSGVGVVTDHHGWLRIVCTQPEPRLSIWKGPLSTPDEAPLLTLGRGQGVFLPDGAVIGVGEIRLVVRDRRAQAQVVATDDRRAMQARLAPWLDECHDLLMRGAVRPGEIFTGRPSADREATRVATMVLIPLMAAYAARVVPVALALADMLRESSDGPRATVAMHILAQLRHHPLDHAFTRLAVEPFLADVPAHRMVMLPLLLAMRRAGHPHVVSALADCVATHAHPVRRAWALACLSKMAGEHRDADALQVLTRMDLSVPAVEPLLRAVPILYSHLMRAALALEPTVPIVDVLSATVLALRGSDLAVLGTLSPPVYLLLDRLASVGDIEMVDVWRGVLPDTFDDATLATEWARDATEISKAFATIVKLHPNPEPLLALGERVCRGRPALANLAADLLVYRRQLPLFLAAAAARRGDAAALARLEGAALTRNPLAISMLLEIASDPRHPLRARAQQYQLQARLLTAPEGQKPKAS